MIIIYKAILIENKMGSCISFCYYCCCNENECYRCGNEIKKSYMYNGRRYCSYSCQQKARTQLLRSTSYNFPT